MKAAKTLKCLGVTAFTFMAAFALSQSMEVSAYTLDHPTQNDIRGKFEELYFNVNDEITYTEEYSVKNPYDKGDVSSYDRTSALNAVNFCRYLAGLPSDVKLDSTFNEYTQASSLVNAANNVLTHTPSKPGNMDTTLYEMGYKGSSESNIAVGYTNIADSVLNGYVFDTDSSNISVLGHRRWVLNPKMQYTGFGMVDRYTAMYAFDRTRSDTFTGDYVAWPPQNMPNELYSKGLSSDYGYAFSVTLGDAYDTPSLSKVTVDIKSELLGKTWHLDSTSTNQKTNYLNVDNNWYGNPKCIIFNVGAFPESDKISVKINGITKSGVSSPITYTVNLFDLFDDDSPYNKVGFDSDVYNVYVGETIKISAYNNPIETKKFTWYSSGNYDAATRVATSTGLKVTGVKPGSFNVYVEDNGVRYTTKVNVLCKHDYNVTSTVSPTCTTDGKIVSTCSICGDVETKVIPKTGHNFSAEWTIDKEATETEEGSKSHHCTVCGEKTDITVIPKLQSVVNNSTISATSINLGASVTMTAKAAGGTAPYRYAYYCKLAGTSKYTLLSGPTTAATYAYKPGRAATYNFAVKIADANNKTAVKYFTVKVTSPLTNNSTISATSIKRGDSVKLTAKAAGGTAPYRYRYYCKPQGSSSYVALTDVTTTASYTHKPARAISYSYAVKVADATGKVITKYFTLKVS